MLDQLTARGKIILSLVAFTLLLMLVVSLYYTWHNHINQAEKLQQATIMSKQQANDINYLQNQLDISKQNAEMLASLVKNAEIGKVKPTTNFTIVSPSLPQATQQVTDRINAKDPALPPVALEKTDRTVVVPNENKTPQNPYDIGVYKVNIDKPRGLGVYVSTESAGLATTYKNVTVFGGKKYVGGNELGVMYQAKW